MLCLFFLGFAGLVWSGQKYPRCASSLAPNNGIISDLPPAQKSATAQEGEAWYYWSVGRGKLCRSPWCCEHLVVVQLSLLRAAASWHHVHKVNARCCHPISDLAAASQWAQKLTGFASSITSKWSKGENLGRGEGEGMGFTKQGGRVVLPHFTAIRASNLFKISCLLLRTLW